MDLNKPYVQVFLGPCVKIEVPAALGNAEGRIMSRTSITAVSARLFFRLPQSRHALSGTAGDYRAIFSEVSSSDGHSAL